MEPIKYPLKCKAGTTFRTSFILKNKHEKPVDFTGFTARMQVREEAESEDALVSLSTEEIEQEEGQLYGQLEFVLDEGRLRVLIPADITTQFEPGSYVYDIEVVSPTGIVDSPFYGRFKVTSEVTRMES
jgi:hypothetical protein